MCNKCDCPGPVAKSVSLQIYNLFVSVSQKKNLKYFTTVWHKTGAVVLIVILAQAVSQNFTGFYSDIFNKRAQFCVHTCDSNNIYIHNFTKILGDIDESW